MVGQLENVCPPTIHIHQLKKKNYFFIFLEEEEKNSSPQKRGDDHLCQMQMECELREPFEDRPRDSEAQPGPERLVRLFV